MICIERVAVDAEPVRAFPEARQYAQPLDRGLGLSFGRIDPDELDLVPVVVALIFVMNHKDCRKRLVQSPSPVRPNRCPLPRSHVLTGDMLARLQDPGSNTGSYDSGPWQNGEQGMACRRTVSNNHQAA